MTNVNGLLNDRQKTHGDYSGMAATSQSLKEVLRATTNWGKMNDGQHEALEMICQKISRICNGDHNFGDHTADIIGYTELYARSSGMSLNGVEKAIAVSLSNVTEAAKAKSAA